MKQLIVIGALLMCSFAAAESIPNCWDSKDAAPKEYVISLESAESTDQLLSAISQVGGSMWAAHSMWPGAIFVKVGARPTRFSDDAAFRAHVEQELSTLQTHHNFEVECNLVMKPF